MARVIRLVMGLKLEDDSSYASALPANTEHVSLPAASVNQLHLEVLVDLVPQVPDVDIHHVADRFVVLVVQVLPDVGATYDLALAVRQVLQERELPGAQLHRPARAGHALAGDVDL